MDMLGKPESKLGQVSQKVGEKGEMQYEIPDPKTPHLVLVWDGTGLRMIRKGTTTPLLAIAAKYLEAMADMEIKSELMMGQAQPRVVRPH